MGLLPRAQAPATIHLLDMGTQVSSGTGVLEARGIKSVSVDDIIAVHGEVGRSRSGRELSGPPAAQARLARLIRQPTTDLRSLDAVDATSVEILLGASRTKDIAGAHFVICAKRAQQAIVRSDSDDPHPPGPLSEPCSELSPEPGVFRTDRAATASNGTWPRRPPKAFDAS